MRPLVLFLSLAGVFAAGVLVGRAMDTSQAPEARVEERATVVRVIDGDTVELAGGERVRYLGMDTPEVRECYADEATARNRELVEGRQVRLVREGQDRDAFGRLLRWLWLEDGTFVNAQLVWEGYARPLFFEGSGYRQVLVQLELAAELSEAGGWSACPWD